MARFPRQIDMDVTLRAATKDDADFLYSLHRAAMQAYVAQTWGQWDEAWQSQYFQQHFDPSARQIIVLHGQDIGTFSVIRQVTDIFLNDIELLPAYQGHGIGTQLIQRLIDEARQTGASITLQVLKVNPARRLYERLGFSISGETPTHYQMSATPLPLPGSARHQSLLRAIAACYEHDDRILALLIFGSLGRGNWDEYSDLDLEVVVRDNVQIDIPGELDRVSTALAEHGEQTLFIEVAGEDGYLVLESLTGIALSYHPVQAMSPYVLEGWRVLIGSLDAATIRSAASANDRTELTLSLQVHRALWLALGVDIIVQRRQFWRALHGLERLRSALLEIFAASHGGKRTYQVFEEQASAELKSKFGRTFPQYFPDSPADNARSLGNALLALLQLIEHDLDQLSNGQVQLGPGERDFIVRLRARVMQAMPASS